MMKKRLLALLLCLMLLLSCGVAAFADGAERTGDIVILYTSDIHCGVAEGFGYAGLEAVRSYHEAKGDKVILVDNGDNIQGEPLGMVTKGESCIELMNDMGYDVAIPGNHEFDYGMDNFLNLVHEADFPYISCNFNYKGTLVFDPYLIKEVDGVKIGFVGVTTPRTIVSSTPKFFQDEEGNYVYDFLADENGEALYSAVQEAVDDARAAGADYVVVLAHLGNQESYHPWNYADVLSHTNGIDIMLDGHSHDSDQVVMKNKDGVDVPRGACGTKLDGIGWCKIAQDGKLSFGLYTWNNTEAVPKLLCITNDMSKAVDKAEAGLADELGQVVAKTAFDLTINDPTEKDSSGAPIRMIRRAETNLGDLCADAVRIQTGADIGVINGGGIRVTLSAGDITYGDILSVHSFGNEVCVIEATGQQILDALEWASSSVPDEDGGFLQVSGLSYEVHSYIDSPCVVKDNTFLESIGDGERRVKNVKVGDQDLDPKATYTLAGHDYVLLNNGNGDHIFDGCTLVMDHFKTDSQALIDYLADDLGGTVSEAYEDPYGQGRIVIVDTKP